MVGIWSDKRVWNHARAKELWNQQVHAYDWKRILNLIIIGVLVIGMNGVVIKLSLSQFYIDPSNLPAENIFDISFYWERLCNQWIDQNLYARECILRFGNLLRIFKTTIHFINLLQYIVITVALGEIRNNKKLSLIGKES